MAIETEAKMKLEDARQMEAKLREAGATEVGKFLEVNAFYDTEDRTMLAADTGLRLRVSTDSLTNEVHYRLTHKGPCGTGPLKTREETELGVESAEDADRLLKKLGFKRYLSFQKRRQSWKLDGCRIELDEVPHLGHFIEIEGPGEEAVMRVRNRLGLADRQLIKSSYVAMLSGYLQERGAGLGEIVFANEPAAGMARAGR
jgi:adenylate cyclase class 2